MPVNQPVTFSQVPNIPSFILVNTPVIDAITPSIFWPILVKNPPDCVVASSVAASVVLATASDIELPPAAAAPTPAAATSPPEPPPGMSLLSAVVKNPPPSTATPSIIFSFIPSTKFSFILSANEFLYASVDFHASVIEPSNSLAEIAASCWAFLYSKYSGDAKYASAISFESFASNTALFADIDACFAFIVASAC